MKEIILLYDNKLTALHKPSQLRGCPDKAGASSKGFLRWENTKQEKLRIL